MKHIPILFSTPMVQAILEGRKTQTRRVVKFNEIVIEAIKQMNEDDPRASIFDHIVLDRMQDGYPEGVRPVFDSPEHADTMFSMKCPYGQPGDVLWVRETFKDGYNAILDSNIGKEEEDWTLRCWVFKDGSQMYSNGKYFPDNKNGTEPSFNGIKWRPSIHMPKAAARIWLQVVSVRVERLQDISQEDALAEGIDRSEEFAKHIGYPCYRAYQLRDRPTYASSRDFSAVDSFKSLWDLINGEQSWNANPWVWVVEFKKIEKPII